MCCCCCCCCYVFGPCGKPWRIGQQLVECWCVYLLRENPLGPGRQHTRLDFMAGRLGPGVGVRIGWVAAEGAGFACGGGQGGVGALQGGSARRCGPPGPPERLQHLGAAAAGGRAGCGR